MSREFFSRIMEHLAGAYLDDRYSQGDVEDAWYEYFGQYDEDVMLKAVENYVKNNDEKPTIAKLRLQIPRSAEEYIAERHLSLQHI